MNKKSKTLLKVFKICETRNHFIFNNDEVKKVCEQTGFKNPFDLTHIDNTDKIPEELKEKDYFPIRLGEGQYQFIKGVKYGYHNFESIQDVRSWKYRKNILDGINSSESNILAVISNQRILYDFLYEDIRQNPNVYGSHRTKHTFGYYLDDNKIDCIKLQIEIDTTLENSGRITVIESKNNLRKDFAIYQLYNPFRRYYDLHQDGKIVINNPREKFEIECCYIVKVENKKNGITSVLCYLYTFEDPKNMSSIQLKKGTQYDLIPH